MTQAPRPKRAAQPDLISKGRQIPRKGGGKHYLIQGMRDPIRALRNVQRKHFTRVDDEGDHARSN